MKTEKIARKLTGLTSNLASLSSENEKYLGTIRRVLGYNLRHNRQDISVLKLQSAELEFNPSKDKIKEFDEPYDGIMYGVAVSLGFAAIENVLYVYMDGGGYQTGLLRMFTAVPAHAVFGVMMGYFVRGKIISEEKNPPIRRCLQAAHAEEGFPAR